MAFVLTVLKIQVRRWYILRNGSDTANFEGVQEGKQYKDNIPGIDQISGTCSQICTGLERLVTRLDHAGIAIQFAVMHNCVRLRNASKCILEAIFTVMVSRTAALQAAEHCW